MDVKEKNQLRTIARSTGSMDPYDQFRAMYESNPQINKTTASEILEVSRKTIQRWVKKLESK
jgi:predicted transcriptional regulator